MKTRLRSLFVLSLLLATSCVVRVQGALISATFKNPTPAEYDLFGSAVAAVGTDKVIIGAYQGASNVGAAFLFSTNGTHLTTFTNPTPAPSDFFGVSVAGFGTDRVLIGDFHDATVGPNVGAAYLFSNNGSLLTVFAHPTPTGFDNFGIAVAAVGSDGVLIGAYGDNTGAQAAGAAFLFTTNGTLVTAFTNPTPAIAEQFGKGLAAVGTDRVLIGCHYNYEMNGQGAAYLFNTNGTLLTTFTNPVPSGYDEFGFAVAAVGINKVLVGAYGVASYVGAAYLFSTNGTLLTTFTNPIPDRTDLFGVSVAAVGADRVLIGSFGRDEGAASLYSTDGTLLATITNITPNDVFGGAVAAIGSDLLIGAEGYANGTGVAYMFSLSTSDPPHLSIEHLVDGNVRLSWLLPAMDCLLEQTDGIASLPATNFWNAVPSPYQTNATHISVNVTPDGNKFYRLRKP